MFQATNFTESTTSFEPLERLQAMGLQAQATFREQKLRDDLAIGAFITQLANNSYLQRMGITDWTGGDFRDDQHRALWAMFSNRMHWLSRWADAAFPRIQISHSYAAMLMATTISAQEVPHVEAPWPAFLIEVPQGLLPIQARDGEWTHVSRIHVNTGFLPHLWTERWWGFELTGKGIEVHRIGPLLDAAIPTPKKQLDAMPLFELPESYALEAKDAPISNVQDFWAGFDRSHEDRVVTLAGRLIVGACVMMTNKANYREKAARLSPALYSFNKRVGGPPVEPRIHVLGRPVKVDFRLAVASFLAGGGRSPSVQTLVAGHHKRQAHGPGNVDRKWIFVEPYWRGEVDAPIVVRPHVV